MTSFAFLPRAASKSTSPNALELGEMVTRVRGDDFRERVEMMRATLATSGKKAADELKIQLPAIMPSRHFTGDRNDPGEATGIIVLDYDNLPPERVPEILRLAKSLPGAVAGFTSPLGRGVKVFVKAKGAGEPGRHEALYDRIGALYQERLGVQPDPNSRESRKLCFLSHDPEAWANESAQELDLPDVGPGEAAPVSKVPLERPDDAEVVGSIGPNTRDQTLARWAGVLRAAGLTVDEMEPALLALNAKRCYEPLPDDDIFRIARSIGKKPRGVAEAISGFIEAGQVKAVLRSVSAEVESSRTIKEPDQFLADFIDAGDVLGIFAKAKRKKSWLALQFAMALAAGRDFLSWRVPKARKVLLVQTEVKQDHYARRTKLVREGLGLEPSQIKALRIIHGRGQNLTIEQITEAAEGHEVEAVIIDPIYPLIAGKENDAEGLRPLMAAFARLAEKGVLVAYIHHDKKGNSGDLDLVDRGSGSSILGRAYDAAIFSDPHKADPDLYVLRSITRNYPPVDDLSLTWKNHAFEVDQNAPAEVNTSASQAAKAARGRPVEALLAPALALLGGRAAWTRGAAEDALRHGLGVGERKAADLVRELTHGGALVVEVGAHGAKTLKVTKVDDFGEMFG